LHSTAMLSSGTETNVPAEGIIMLLEERSMTL
jgi:hypothetical protein